MKPQVINLETKFNLFQDQWSPKIITQMNDLHYKIAKIQGDFIWHSHPETDETFIVIKGRMQIEFPDRTIALEAGEMVVVPKGVAHKPTADHECHILMVEPAGTINTGDADSDRKVTTEEWIKDETDPTERDIQWWSHICKHRLKIPAITESPAGIKS